MKFGDKLISLRKSAGFSQEELASKLNVSRQSVSKWESNNTYPETDKIVQICNIFDCKMDDLINDKVTDVKEVRRQDKNNFSVAFDSLLLFITKTINMFSSMKFGTGLKCVLEVGVLSLILLIISFVVTEIGTSLIMGFLSFTSGDIHYYLYRAISAIFGILTGGVSIIIVVHAFKIRYLDVYDKVIAESQNKSEDILEDKQTDLKGKKIFNTKKETKIIIRDKNTTFLFLNTLAKIIVGFFKVIVVGISVAFIFTLILFVAIFVFLVPLIRYAGVLISGIELSLLGAIVINILILLVSIYFVINKKINLKMVAYFLLGSFVLAGIGVGLFLIGLTDFKYEKANSDKDEYVTKSMELKYRDNMAFDSMGSSDEIVFKVNNSLGDNIIVTGEADKNWFIEMRYYINHEYGIDVYVPYDVQLLQFKTLYNMLISDLKDKTFGDYEKDEASIYIECSEKVMNKLISNFSKIYLFEKVKVDDQYILKNIKDRIYLDYSCDMSYDAISGEYTTSPNCTCEMIEGEAANGKYIGFECFHK